MPILNPVTPCVTVIKKIAPHVWPKALRVIRRTMLRHAHKALGASVAIVTCAAPPALYFSLPPATAPAGAPTPMAENMWTPDYGAPIPVAVAAPHRVPEPATWLILALPMATLLVVRGVRS